MSEGESEGADLQDSAMEIYDDQARITLSAGSIMPKASVSRTELVDVKDVQFANPTD